MSIMKAVLNVWCRLTEFVSVTLNTKVVISFDVPNLSLLKALSKYRKMKLYTELPPFTEL
jgi:hypothetical protein